MRELTARAIVAFELCPTDTPDLLDYVCLELEGGTTLKAVAESIGEATKLPITAPLLERQLGRVYGTAKTEAALTSARLRATHTFEDDAIAISDEPVSTMMEVSRNASRMRSRMWLADRRKPTAKAVGVTVNIGNLHIDAMRKRTIGASASISLPPDATSAGYAGESGEGGMLASPEAVTAYALTSMAVGVGGESGMLASPEAVTAYALTSMAVGVGGEGEGSGGE